MSRLEALAAAAAAAAAAPAPGVVARQQEAVGEEMLKVGTVALAPPGAPRAVVLAGMAKPVRCGWWC